jgi:hypothetical protein
MEKRPPDMEGSCEYIKQTVADNRQGVVQQLRGYETWSSDSDRSFGKARQWKIYIKFGI